MSGAAYKILLVRHPVPYLPESRIDYQEVPHRQGGVAQDTLQRELIIELDCYVEAASEALLKTQMGAIKAKLVSGVDKSLRLDVQSDRFWNARLSSGIQARMLGMSNVAFPLSFIAADPNAFSTAETDAGNQAISSSPDTLTVGSAGTSGDETLASPVWYLRNGTGGAVSTITLNNTTTGEVLTWANNLNAGFWIKIDVAKWQVSRSTGAGADPTALSFTDPVMTNVSGIFPRIDTLVQNSVTVTGLSTGTLRAIYRVRYL